MCKITNSLYVAQFPNAIIEHRSVCEVNFYQKTGRSMCGLARKHRQIFASFASIAIAVFTLFELASL